MDTGSLEQNQLSKKIETSETSVPQPDNLIKTKEGLEDLRERTQRRIKSKMGASIQQGRENLSASVDRLKGSVDEKTEGQELLKPVEAKIISLSDAYQKKISAELKAEGIGINAIPMPKEPLPLEVPNVDFSKLPNETKASEVLTAAELKAQGIGVNAIPIKREKQPAFAEDTLREGLKMQGVPTDIAEQIIAQEKAKAEAKQKEASNTEEIRKKYTQEQHSAMIKKQQAEIMAKLKGKKSPTEKETPKKSPLEELQEKYRKAEAEARAKKMMEDIKAEKFHGKKEKAAQPPLPEFKGDEKKLAGTELKETKQAQELLAQGMNMKKNIDAWNELIDNEMLKAGTKPEKQGRINKIFNKIRSLIDKAENLVNKILDRNKMAAVSRVLSKEGRSEFLAAQAEKIASKLGGKNVNEKAEEKAREKKPKFDAKKLQAYLETMGVPQDLAQEIIKQEEKEGKRLESQGKRSGFAKEAERRLKQLEQKIIYQAVSAQETIKDVKKGLGRFKDEINTELKKAGTEWKKMNVMESMASKFQSYLNKADTLMITEAERRAIRKQQKKIEAERKQTLKTIEKQAEARRKQESSAKEAARKKAQKEAAAKAKEQKQRQAEQRKADKAYEIAQKNLSKAQQEIARAENRKKEVAAKESARQAKEEAYAQKQEEKKQRAEKVKSHYKEVEANVKARQEAAKEMNKANAESKRAEAEAAAKPKAEETPQSTSKNEGGEQLYGREAEGYDALAKEMATKVEVKPTAPAEKKPDDQFKKAA